MMRDIRESDWKLLKELHGIAMERFFQRAMAGFQRKAGNERVTNKERFWDIHDQAKTDARLASELFDDYLRSTAKLVLLRWRAEGLIKEEEMGRFSTDLQEQVKQLMDMRGT